MRFKVKNKETGEIRPVEISDSIHFEFGCEVPPNIKQMKSDVLLVLKDLANWNDVLDEDIEIQPENIKASITWFEDRIAASGGFQVRVDDEKAVISISKGFEGQTDLEVEKEWDPVFYDQCRRLAMLMQVMIVQDKDRGPMGKIFAD
ncbi:MAG: hypothetical protein PHY72_00990 [Candidatus Pacebacteria bacterium]|nr:hypothetical protein [Candidatus Paceibacterota bacterium]